MAGLTLHPTNLMRTLLDMDNSIIHFTNYKVIYQVKTVHYLLHNTNFAKGLPAFFLGLP